MHFTDKAALKQSAVLNRSSEDVVIDTWTPLDSTGASLDDNQVQTKAYVYLSVISNSCSVN